MTTIYYHDVAGKSPRDPNGDPDRCLLCDGTESLNAEDYCPCHFDECDCETCGWREMESAPRDGTPVILRVRHLNWELAGAHDRDKWQQDVTAYWIEHNSGGWTWSGLYGTPIAWKPADDRNPICECGHPRSEHRKGWAYGLETFHCEDCGCPEFNGGRR